MSNHVPISVAFIIVDRYGNLVHEFVYSGYDCAVRLIKNMLECEDKLVYSTKFKKYMIYGDDERIIHQNSNVCYICKK